MTLWTDIATWQGPTPNTAGTITEHRYVVLHIAEGSYEGTIAWQRNPKSNVSSHFVVSKEGRIAQMLDTAAKSWAQRQGNPYSISVECEGWSGHPLTADQIEACARIVAKAHLVHGVPLQLTDRVGRHGLGHHSMGFESGVDWGHQFCPGNWVKAQKSQILAWAVQMVAVARGESSHVPEGGDDMTIVGLGADRFLVVPGRGLVQITWAEWVASGWDKNPPRVLMVATKERLRDFDPAAAK